VLVLHAESVFGKDKQLGIATRGHADPRQYSALASLGYQFTEDGRINIIGGQLGQTREGKIGGPSYQVKEDRGAIVFQLPDTKL